MSDAEGLDQLMTALAEGNREAFTPLFQRLWEPTRALCAQLMGSSSDGDDAAQTAMLRIFERANAYDPRRPALPWAMGIASWECRSLLKRRSRRRETDAPVVVSDDGAAVAEQEQRELLAAAREALGTLSPADQETLIATYWETASGVSGATLRKRRERALTRLRDAFRRMYGFD